MSKPKYTPEQFDKLIDDFIQEVEAGNIPRPSDYRLSVYTGLSISTLERYYVAMNDNNISLDNSDRDKATYIPYGRSIKKLVAYRADRLTGLAEQDSKQTASAIFQLKQAHNGGYTDKQQTETSGNIAINVTLKGANGEDLKR